MNWPAECSPTPFLPLPPTKQWGQQINTSEARRRKAAEYMWPGVVWDSLFCLCIF